MCGNSMFTHRLSGFANLSSGDLVKVLMLQRWLKISLNRFGRFFVKLVLF